MKTETYTSSIPIPDPCFYMDLADCVISDKDKKKKRIEQTGVFLIDNSKY
jgi:hypothetical protein